DLGDDRSRFGSWEQATGWSFRLMRRFWIAHFEFVKDRSLDGARRLEEVYRKEGKIDRETLKPRRMWPFWSALAALLLLVAAGAVGAWFYVTYLRPVEVDLAPGVRAVLGGGGNSLIVEDGGELLVVDPKFPPASGWLRRRISKSTNAPVRTVVNTHYHYDHTEGNAEYPGAKIFAHRAVPDLMMKYDGRWWGERRGAMPAELVDETSLLRVGGQEVMLIHPGSPAHTRGDLWVFLRRGGVEIVVTGDLVSHTFYPFIDLNEGGTDVPGVINAVRRMASQYPNALFVPGHGPVARAGDLLRFADYLQFIYDSVAAARRKGLSEDEAAAGVDSSRWDFRVLPSYHNGKLCWATAETNVRWVYRMQSGTIDPRENCTF
ncbi:MAG: MBL fold metallo-hydrolase, partial [Pyrinomonadaceae bacterium]